MINLCTLFNANYLSRGMVLYNSLAAACHNFHLYVFAFDDASCNYLRSQNLPHITVISLKEFEDEQLLKVKPSRTAAEYCWTCTPSTILYCIQTFGLDNCTYIDADMYFYADPAILLAEVKDASALIVKHNYTPLYDQAKTTGIYCVEFMYFKNTEEGMAVLNWWREACLNWCYARVEDGKFGDQKYLDEWPQRFKGVHVLEHPGGGVAPWNIQQFNATTHNNSLFINYKNQAAKYPVVFFHFHGLKFFKGNRVLYTDALYELAEEITGQFYEPYVARLAAAAEKIQQTVSFDPNGSAAVTPGKLLYWKKYFMNFAKFALKNKPLSLFAFKNYNFKYHYHLHQYNNSSTN